MTWKLRSKFTPMLYRRHLLRMQMIFFLSFMRWGNNITYIVCLSFFLSPFLTCTSPKNLEKVWKNIWGDRISQVCQALPSGFIVESLNHSVFCKPFNPKQWTILSILNDSIPQNAKVCVCVCVCVDWMDEHVHVHACVDAGKKQRIVHTTICVLILLNMCHRPTM